jgi:hypothetical protein
MTRERRLRRHIAEFNGGEFGKRAEEALRRFRWLSRNAAKCLTSVAAR